MNTCKDFSVYEVGSLEQTRPDYQTLRWGPVFYDFRGSFEHSGKKAQGGLWISQELTRRCADRGRGRFAICKVRTCSSNTLRSDCGELAGNSWPQTEQYFKVALVTRCGGRGCMNMTIGCPIASLVSGAEEFSLTSAHPHHPSEFHFRERSAADFHQ